MSAVLVVVVLVVVAAAAARGIWSPCGLSMLSAMNPVAERGRGHRFGVTVGWFVAGALLGGAVLGAVGSVLAAVVDLTGVTAAGRAAVVAVGAVLVLAVDRGLVPWARLPLVPRQVDETWLGTYRRWIYATGYGVQLGAGVATYVMTAAVGLVVVVGAVATPAGALGLGLVFGLVRGLALLAAAPARDLARLGRLLATLEVTDTASLATVDAVVALLAVVAAVTVHPAWGAATALGLLLAAVAARVARRSTRTPAAVVAQPRASVAPGS